MKDMLADFWRDGLRVSSRGDATILTMPFAYPNGEVIQLLVKPDGDEWVVSDMGTTDGFLAERGVDWGAPGLGRAVKAILGERRVQYRKGILRKRCRRRETLIGCIMDVLEAALAIGGAAYAPVPARCFALPAPDCPLP